MFYCLVLDFIRAIILDMHFIFRPDLVNINKNSSTVIDFISQYILEQKSQIK